MVNTNFYSALNQLMSAVNSGLNVIDYDSFIDAGKTLSLMSTSDLVNEFLTPLMNKVQKTIMDTPSYKGMLTDMYEGTLDYGVLEMLLMDKFYSMDAATFDGQTISDGVTYTDQFTVHMPDMSAVYYTMSDSWQKTITIRDTDLKGAFTSPQRMDRFIAGIFMQITNSVELAKETSRLACMARSIKTALATTPNLTDETKPACYYGLLSIYNTKMGTSLTQSNCLYSPDFVKWAVAAIRDLRYLMAKPIDSFNSLNFQTFTDSDHFRLKISSLFDKAIRTMIIDAYNPQYGVIDTNYEVLPYWQSGDERLKIETAATGTSVPSEPIIAVMYDSRAIGEMIQTEEVATTRNEMRRYTNYHYLFNRMYWNNDHANFVVFTLA